MLVTTFFTQRSAQSKVPSHSTNPLKKTPFKLARRHGVVALVAAVLLMGAVFSYARLPAFAAPGPVTGLSLVRFPTTLRVQWNKSADATGGYRVTLIRQRDQGIMRQYVTKDSVTDVQPIFPGESYVVAIQGLDSSGTAGPAALSSVVQSDNSSINGMNGFLDQMNLAQGQIDTNLWNEHIFYANRPFQGSTFINDQIHGHIAAGCLPTTDCAGDQTVTTMNSRVPVNVSGRTLTVHGEVDLKGDDHQWFGAILSPQIIGPDRVLDEVDRFYKPLNMPQLELFTFEGHTKLLYAAGNNTDPTELASIADPTGISNVRDDIVWRTSSTTSQVIVNGKSVMNVTLPKGLGFTSGYLSLFAEDYPNSGGTNGQPSCDQFPNDCAIWHLDDWGFDAPAGTSQPLTMAYYSNGCGPYPGNIDEAVTAVACDDKSTSGSGSTITYSVNVPNASNLTAARVAFDAQRFDNPSALTVSVNGGSAVSIPYVADDHNTYNYQSYTVSVPASLLHSGSNSVVFRQAASNDTGNITVANVQIETVSSTHYTPPALPAQPAPSGTWGSGGSTSNAPTISGFTPTHGQPGTTITVDGTHLTGTTAVRFSGNANGGGLSVKGDGELTVVVPEGAQTGTFTVVTPNGSVTSASAFTVDPAGSGTTTINISNAPCTVTMPDGTTQKGTCSGTLTTQGSMLVSALLRYTNWIGIIVLIIAAGIAGFTMFGVHRERRQLVMSGAQDGATPTTVQVGTFRSDYWKKLKKVFKIQRH